MATAAPQYKRHALGLPAGSVRALLARGAGSADQRRGAGQGHRGAELVAGRGIAGDQLGLLLPGARRIGESATGLPL